MAFNRQSRCVAAATGVLVILATSACSPAENTVDGSAAVSQPVALVEAPIKTAEPQLLGTYEEGNASGYTDASAGNWRQSTSGYSEEWIRGYNDGYNLGFEAKSANAISAPGIGEPFELPGVAEFVINSAERVDEIPSSSPRYTPNLTPQEGGTLFLLTMNWTNLSNEVVGKVCWGPYSSNLKVFDTQGRELMLSDDSGFIPGNECSSGLMNGQSGDWYQAFYGLSDSELGYAVFTSYVDGEQYPVILNPSVSLKWEN